MFKLMQTAGALGLAGVLAMAPLAAIAQTAPETAAPDAPAQFAPEPAPESGTSVATDETAPLLPIEGIIQMQAAGTLLATDLIGAAVHNMADENIGNVDDLVMAADGSVEGVVIGVGGFLGIGRKLVAVEMDQLVVEADASGQPSLRLDAPRAALEAAPEFVTAEAQATEADRLDIDRVEPTGATTPAPGAEPAGTPAGPVADE